MSSLLLISGAMFLRNPADLGTRNLTLAEIGSADLRWNGSEFLKKSRQDWAECKFDQPTSTENLELKGTKETGTKDATVTK